MRNWMKMAAVGLGVLAAIGVLGGVIYWRESARGPCSAKPEERWSNGAVKTATCDWSEQNLTFVQQCSYLPDGENLGCGTIKEGIPWEGVIVDWHYKAKSEQDELPTKPRAITRYKRGRPDGEWRTYYRNGQLMNEITFSEGRRVRLQRYREDGTPEPELKF